MAFGQWESRDANIVYTAETDGFVVASSTTVTDRSVTEVVMVGYSPANQGTKVVERFNPNDGSQFGAIHCLTFPVRAGDTWNVGVST